ncbi:MAG: prolyl oligopeptidase family serine peptidase [Mariniphaga sp.]
MKKAFIFALFFLICGSLKSQVDVTYQIPPKEILELADAPQAPAVLIDDRGKNIVLIHRNKYISIHELSQPELRLAGLRINPATNMGSRTTFYNNLSLMKVGEKEEMQVDGLPAEPALSNFSWSPDQTRLAFTNTTSEGVELWLLDLASATARRILEDNLNVNLQRPFFWFPDGKNFLVKMLPEDKKPLIDKSKAVPTGPRISVSSGEMAQNRTYQDLLQDKADEFNFEQLARSEIYKIDLKGKKTLWEETAIYSRIDISPDGKYVLVETIKKPFSYLVPYNRFPSVTTIYDKNGKKVKTLLESPLLENLPKGFMATQPGIRNINWRNDKPSTIYYVEALDEGNPENETEFRDEVFEWPAPFDGEPKSLVKTKNRYAGIEWGNDEIALVNDRWWNTRNAKTYVFNPSSPDLDATVLFDRNYQDSYNFPGNFLTKKNNLGQNTLVIDDQSLYLTGPGYSPEGIRPFFRKINLNTKETEDLWRADGTETLEQIIKVLDLKKGELLTRVEANSVFPNYYIRNIKKKIAPQQITFFKNPYESLLGIHKELITYQRNDGVELSATLYLPAGYDKEKKEKLPMLMWAYPREYKDVASAGQITSSPHYFTAPYYGSPVFWVTRGFVVLDDAAFPIIGEGDKEPNDSFREQLVANAKAAIDAVNKMGYIDSSRVAVGGHSYGAFMTANLLSHSDLFAAGIARSGAYNRTLTPFGFQSEERTYWEAPEVYYSMSPFMHSDKMKTPLLLIHGEADNNSGTYPLQSERYFNALKGMGATARLVFLPKESHGYSARESILHVLWEQDQWLEKWVKNKNKTK